MVEGIFFNYLFQYNLKMTLQFWTANNTDLEKHVWNSITQGTLLQVICNCIVDFHEFFCQRADDLFGVIFSSSISIMPQETTYKRVRWQF